MSYCSGCGNALNGAFCSSCGAKAVQSAAVNTSAHVRKISALSAIKRLAAVVVIGQVISTFFAYLNAGNYGEQFLTGVDSTGVDPTGAAMMNLYMQLTTLMVYIIGCIIDLFIIRAIGRGSWKARRFLGYLVTLGIIYAVLVLLNYRHVTNGYMVGSVFAIIFNSVVLSMLNNQAMIVPSAAPAKTSTGV